VRTGKSLAPARRIIVQKATEKEMSEDDLQAVLRLLLDLVDYTSTMVSSTTASRGTNARSGKQSVQSTEGKSQ
jgi:hypothetical protein